MKKILVLTGAFAMAIRAMAADPVIDPAADAILGKLAECMQKAQRMSCTMTVQMHNEMEGMRQDITTTYAISAERPIRIAIRQIKGMPTFTVISDGSNLCYHLPMVNRYSAGEAPRTYDEFFRTIGAMGANMLFVDNLMGGEVKATLLENVRKATLAGKAMVNGQECDWIRFEQDEFDWELWVTRGATPVVLKVMTDVSKGMGEAGGRMPGMKGMKMTVEHLFEGWTLDAALPADVFVFRPPEGASKVKSLFEDTEEIEPQQTLEGKPAPAFSLDLLDGGKAVVPALKATEPSVSAKGSVVVLDFWASWCGPCRRVLPTVAKVASEYKDKGVVFYAVNQQELPDQVKKFMEKEGLSCPVAMDADGKVGQAYQVQGIPQTVLIGKDGTVQAVHIGLVPDLEKTLREQLDTLVSGKSLIGK